MARKKNRSDSKIARKRAKRKQNQKFRQRKSTVASRTPQTNEKQIRELIVESQTLALEPELENIDFDRGILWRELMEFLETHGSSEIEMSDRNYQFLIAEHLRSKVICQLINPAIVQKIISALETVKSRFEDIGDRTKLEVAAVAIKLLIRTENEPETMALHPLLVRIVAKTLGRILGESSTRRHFNDRQIDALHEVKEELVEVSTCTPDEWYDRHARVQTNKNDAEKSEHLEVSDEKELVAKALYRNLDRWRTRDKIEGDGNYRIADENGNKEVKYVHRLQNCRLTLSHDRLTVHTSSMEELSVAMTGIEELCGSSLFYLAKTIGH